MVIVSITGQVGHVAIARQTAFGNPNTTASQYVAMKITGDSLVASNNPLIAEGEIGMGRDISDAVPGGFVSAGAINGNLRARPAALLLEGSLGAKTLGSANTSWLTEGAFSPVSPGIVAGNWDEFRVSDTQPVYTIEKKVGPASPQQLVLRYQDAIMNTLNITAPAGALSTFSVGLITAGESRQPSVLATPSYPSNADDLLVFHGGRINVGLNNALVTRDDTFQSVEISINNNIAADEFTVRPSRFLRSFTEGIRSIDSNFTLVFENPDKYSRYTYGLASGAESVVPNAPGYSFYTGAMEVFLGNWRIGNNDTLVSATLDIFGNALPASPQGVQITLPKLVFTGFPVALASGRIVVTTSARALKDTTYDIVIGQVRPTAAGLAY